MLASRRAPREPSLHEIPRSFIAPHRQVSLTPHEAEIRLVLPGAHPRFTRENQTFFERSKVSLRMFLIEFSFFIIQAIIAKNIEITKRFRHTFWGPTQHVWLFCLVLKPRKGFVYFCG